MIILYFISNLKRISLEENLLFKKKKAEKDEYVHNVNFASDKIRDNNFSLSNFLIQNIVLHIYV